MSTEISAVNRFFVHFGDAREEVINAVNAP